MRSEKYTSGRDRYVNFAHDFLGLQLAETQKQIMRAVTEHQRILIISGNGVGKSYGVGGLGLGFLFTNPDSIVMGTSGSYGQFIDTMWRPTKGMYRTLKEEHGLPGRVYDGNKPKIELDDEWYFNVASPRDPGELEGRHGSDVLVIIEEADKEYITEEHFDSAGSSITDMNDKMVAVANPPKDEANVVYEKAQSDRWHVIQFESFQSHNVKYDLGEVDQQITGLTDLITVAGDWEAWNDEPWPKTPDDWPGVSTYKQLVDKGEVDRETLIKKLRPGAEEAFTAHLEHDNLDTRWYRRRVGQIPPQNASRFRPIQVEDVENAYQGTSRVATTHPEGAALDVARSGGDSNVLAGKHGDVLRIHDDWKGTDHNTNEQTVRNKFEQWPDSIVFAVDAKGEGSGLADRLANFIPELVRFDAGAEAANKSEFYDRWTEGLYKLGQFLKNGGVIDNRRLREELLAAARTVTLEERYYKSRDTTVLKATKKDKVRDRLGRSPDMLDAAYMAVWASSDAPHSVRKTQRLVW